MCKEDVDFEWTEGMKKISRSAGLPSYKATKSSLSLFAAFKETILPFIFRNCVKMWF